MTITKRRENTCERVTKLVDTQRCECLQHALKRGRHRETVDRFVNGAIIGVRVDSRKFCVFPRDADVPCCGRGHVRFGEHPRCEGAAFEKESLLSRKARVDVRLGHISPRGNAGGRCPVKAKEAELNESGLSETLTVLAGLSPRATFRHVLSQFENLAVVLTNGFEAAVIVERTESGSRGRQLSHPTPHAVVLVGLHQSIADPVAA